MRSNIASSAAHQSHLTRDVQPPVLGSLQNAQSYVIIGRNDSSGGILPAQVVM